MKKYFIIYKLNTKIFEHIYNNNSLKTYLAQILHITY